MISRRALGACVALSIVLDVVSHHAVARGAAFGAGHLVVVPVGADDAASPLQAASTAVFLKELTLAGTPVQSVALPTAGSGAQRALTLAGTATSEGFLTLSANGQLLTLMGYGVTPGVAGPQASSPDVAPRVLGRVDLATGSVDTATAFATGGSPGDAFNGSNVRSAVATDADHVWMGGNASTGNSGSSGVRYVTSDATSIRINAPGFSANVRVVNMFNGQLYVSSASSAFQGISKVGAGLPITELAAPMELLPGFPTDAGPSMYDFWFKDAATLFVADDSAINPGIQKWTLSGGVWSYAYNVTAGAARGLAGTVNGSSQAVLYATSSTSLIAAADSAGGTVTPTVLATAPVNTAFRGVELIPAPEPASGLLLATGAMLCSRVRRRRASRCV